MEKTKHLNWITAVTALFFVKQEAKEWAKELNKENNRPWIVKAYKVENVQFWAVGLK